MLVIRPRSARLLKPRARERGRNIHINRREGAMGDGAADGTSEGELGARWMVSDAARCISGLSREASILERNAGRAGRGRRGLDRVRGSGSAGHCDGEEMCTKLGTAGGRRHEMKCRDGQRVDDRVGDDGMDLAQARQKGANRVGQFKFFEVFMAAECRQIPRLKAPATFHGAPRKSSDPVPEEEPFYWTASEPRGPQPASIGQGLGRC